MKNANIYCQDICFGLVAFVDFGFLNYKSEQKVSSQTTLSPVYFPDILTTDVESFTLLEMPAVNDNSLRPKLQGYQAA